MDCRLATNVRLPAPASASTVTVTVVQCINSGIDNDATSTMAQHVMCTCGFRTRKKIQANPHDASEQQGAQRRLRQNRQHYFLLPFAFAFATWSASVRN